jgi:hypothetical protein
MSKLPSDFVKAPTTEPKPRARRTRKASLISAEPVVDPRQCCTSPRRSTRPSKTRAEP